MLGIHSFIPFLVVRKHHLKGSSAESHFFFGLHIDCKFKSQNHTSKIKGKKQKCKWNMLRTGRKIMFLLLCHTAPAPKWVRWLPLWSSTAADWLVYPKLIRGGGYQIVWLDKHLFFVTKRCGGFSDMIRRTVPYPTDRVASTMSDWWFTSKDRRDHGRYHTEIHDWVFSRRA